MTPTQLKEAIENETIRAYELGEDYPYELAYRIAALTAECMVSQQKTIKVSVCASDRTDEVSSAVNFIISLFQDRQRQLADEIKKLSE